MAEYHGGPHHGRTVPARVGPKHKRPTHPRMVRAEDGSVSPDRVELFIVEGTRFLHPVGDDPFHVAIYVAQRGKIVYEGERRLTKPYPTVIEPRVWPRLRLE